MPVQVQKSTLAKRLGAKLVEAHLKHKDAPVKVDGGGSLPDGIENGVARLQRMSFGTYKPGTKSAGKEYFMVEAIMVAPKYFVKDGQKIKIEGARVKPKMITLDDTPEAEGEHAKKTFAEHYFDFQNLFKVFGVEPPETTDPQAVQNYYEAAAKSLTDGKNNPHFKLRTWKGKKATEGKYKDKEPLTQESWGDMCEYTPVGDDVADGMSAAGTSDVAPPPSTTMSQESFNEFASNTPNADDAQPGDTPADPSDEIAALVETANADPDNTTDAGKAAKIRLEELAVAAGATPEQVGQAADWEAVAAMALGIMPEEPTSAAPAVPTVGQKAKFKKRDSKGDPLKDGKTKAEFAAQEIEIVTVDTEKQTVTAKGKDGKPVQGLDRKPTQIKWEWLE